MITPSILNTAERRRDKKDGAPVTVKIQVTAGDIAGGRKMSCRHCPVALAIGRLLGKCSVTPYFVKFAATRRAIALPLGAQRFIANFDYGKPVVPFSFKLRLPVNFLAA